MASGSLRKKQLGLSPSTATDLSGGLEQITLALFICFSTGHMWNEDLDFRISKFFNEVFKILNEIEDSNLRLKILWLRILAFKVIFANMPKKSDFFFFSLILVPVVFLGCCLLVVLSILSTCSTWHMCSAGTTVSLEAEVPAPFLGTDVYLWEIPLKEYP